MRWKNKKKCENTVPGGLQDVRAQILILELQCLYKVLHFEIGYPL